MSKRITNTDKVELVETHNLALALTRLIVSTPYDYNRWKRALNHAIGMTVTNREEQQKLREALGLP
jgi:molybdopterin converting factor small subunit